MNVRVFVNPDAAREMMLAEQRKAPRIIDLTDDPTVTWSMVRIPKGTASGSSSVIFQLVLPDGSVLMLQTSLALLEGACAAFAGGDERDRDLERPGQN